jgi:hypothetical protein
MTERPILFNTEMVRAVLDGRKTQTRRLVKGLPLAEPWFTVEDGRPMMCDENGEWYPAERFSTVQPGDILWVRETWNGGRLFGQKGNGYAYAADYKGQSAFGWRPSIHMPKEAARLFLLVKDVRMERLQDMKMSDIKAEGVVPSNVTGGHWQQWQQEYMKPVWDGTIKKTDLRRFGWDANPWVWVIEFERINPQNQ